MLPPMKDVQVKFLSAERRWAPREMLVFQFRVIAKIKARPGGGAEAGNGRAAAPPVAGGLLSALPFALRGRSRFGGAGLEPLF